MGRDNKNISRIMETLLAKCKFELLSVLFSLNLNEILDLNDNTKGYCHIHNLFYSCIFFVLSNPWGTSLFTLY